MPCRPIHCCTQLTQCLLARFLNCWTTFHWQQGLVTWGINCINVHIFWPISQQLNMAENIGSHLSSAEQAEFQHHFPRMSWWLGMAPSHPNYPDTQTSQPASFHWDQYVAYHINQTVQTPGQSQSFQARSSCWDPHAVHPIDQPPCYNPIRHVLPHYNSVRPAPPHYSSIEPAPPPYVPPANISVSVPLNSGVVGGVVSCALLRLPLDIPFRDFFSHVCTCMDLDPLEATLRYKFHTDRV